jgi:hypothetical protein
MLSQIPQSDVVTSEHWGTLKKSISLSLGDEDDRISVSVPFDFIRGSLVPILQLGGWEGVNIAQ